MDPGVRGLLISEQFNRCACVRWGSLVTPYRRMLLFAGCDKFALANAGTQFTNVVSNPILSCDTACSAGFSQPCYGDLPAKAC